MNFKLDLQTHDIFVDSFTFATVITEQEEITQRLKIKLLMFKEEWFLDRNYGIPYLQEIFVKGVDKDDIDSIYKIAISEEAGVQDLISYSSVFNASTREFSVDAKIRTTNGSLVSISITV